MNPGNPSPAVELTDEQLAAIVRSIDGLCTLPASTARLVELLEAQGAHARASDDQTLLDAMVELAQSDLAMAVRLLAESPGAATVRAAIERMGLAAAGQAMLSISFQTPAPGALDRPAFWRHCQAVAGVARAIAAQTDRELADEAFICGLLHDMGKAALDQCMPKSYRRALEAAAAHHGSLQQCELAALGVDHCGLGRRLAAQWRLPASVVQTIWLHHHATGALGPRIPDRRMILIVSLADAIARRAAVGFSGNLVFTRNDELIAQELGLSAQALQELAASLPPGNESDAVSDQAAPECAAAQSSALYAGVVRQMERLSGRLAEKSRAELARVNEFLQDMPCDAAPADVVLAAAAKAAEVVASATGPAGGTRRPCLAYAICRDDCVLFASNDCRTPGECLNLEAAAGPHDGIPDGMSAPEAMQRLVQDPSQLGQWADLSQMRHMPLRAGGRWVGGMLFPVGTDAAALSSLAPAMAAALAAADQRRQSDHLSEQLAQAGRSLAAAQEALAESRTMAAIGELASGAAHELNNPLAVISGRAQLMRQRATEDKDRATWQTIVEQAQRISDLLTELMDFASPAKASPSPLDAGAILREAAESFAKSGHPQAASAITDIRMAGSAPRAYADREQVVWALRELIANAAAAAPGGKVVLSAAASPAGRTVCLTVADSGPGMDQATLAEAFTPFFSRQPAGRRRGLGLSRARRYVQNNGGRIWIQSQPGRGTTVYVELPAKGD